MKLASARFWRAFLPCFLGILLLGGALPVFGYALHGYTWPNGTEIRMHLQLTRASGALQDGSGSWNASAADALNIWNQNIDAVKFVADSPSGSSGENGANEVFFTSTVYGDAWPTGTLAVTLRMSSQGSVFTETDVLFNSKLNWDSYRGPAHGFGPSGTYDLHRVALHEFGHVLGLDHPDEYGQSVAALMNSTTGDLDHLTDDDIAGANSLYGLRLTSATAAQGSAGEPFTFQLTANFPDVTFSSSDLPAGLMVDAAGLISGTPAGGGNFVIHITLTRNGRSVTVSMTLNIKGGLRPIEGSTGLTVMGDEGATPVGSNSFYFTPQQGPFYAQGGENPNGVTLGAVTFGFNGPGDNWRLRFTAPGGVPLTVGRYEGLNGSGEGPSMTLTRGSVTSGGPGGYFEIKSITYGLGTQLREFDAVFEMYTGVDSPAIRGEARCFVDPTNPPGTPIITSPLSVQLAKGVPLNYTITATNNPIRYRAHGLPYGLVFDPATATISGTPASNGCFDLVLAADNYYGTGTARLKLTVSAPTPPHTLQNIATRLFVGTDADVAIAGFILAGDSPKTVAVRGMGPSLNAAGISGVLPDPQLEIRDSWGIGSGVNDNWLSEWGTAYQSGLSPTDRKESAVIRGMKQGNSTAILQGVGTGSRTGVGLIEVYDLDATSGSRFANISTRGRVKTGENVMIGGFILGGDQATRIVVRGIGPSLAASGVAGALSDPVLALHNSQGAIMHNDNWRNGDEQAMIATGLAPADDREAAVLVILVPGNYTAILSGKNDTSGVGLIEIYNLDAN